MRHWIRIGNLYINKHNIVDIAATDEYVLIRTVDGRKITVYMNETARNILLRHLNHETTLHFVSGVSNENH